MKKQNKYIAKKHAIRKELKGLSYSDKRNVLIATYITIGKSKNKENFSMKKSFEKVQNMPLTELIGLTAKIEM